MANGRSGLADATGWFDGHLDLASLALEGRDLTVPLGAAVGKPQPAAVTFPSLLKGGIFGCFGTIFTAPDLEGPLGYPARDAVEGAHAAGLRQQACYEGWARQGRVRLLRSALELEPVTVEGPPLQVLILMEGADPIRSPEEVGWWHARGLRAVGLSWAMGTRYAGGNAKPGPLTETGREMVAALDEHGIVHDLSHLPDEAAWELLELSRGPVMASHSNCRVLVNGQSQRHLPDDLIRAIAARGGMIGLNLFSLFLSPEGKDRRATIEETIAHVEQVCDLAGRRDVVGLGSDLDGGFGADRLPEGIDEPADLTQLVDALARRGWTSGELAGFQRENWLRFLRASAV